MPSTFSPNKILELQATGENDGTWGSKANANFSIIDKALGGRTNLDVSGNTDVTLSAGQAQNIYHNLTGTLTGNINYIFPASAGGLYVIKNATSGAFTITVKIATGSGLVLTQGQTVTFFIDPDQNSAEVSNQVALVSGGGLEFSGSALQRSALTGDVTASAGSNTTVLGITTTRGDIITRGASANQRLALGAANTLLSSNGTDAVYQTLTAIMDAILGSTNGLIANRAGGVWTGTALTALIGLPLPRVTSVASSATPAPSATTDDVYELTALAAAAAFSAPAGTPADQQKLLIRIKDNGTARALTWNAIYRAGTDIPLPSTTVLSKTMYLGFIYNSADSKWDLVGLVNNI